MNCDRCGRYLPDFDCPHETSYQTKDGEICGCCIREYLEEKDFEKRLENANVLLRGE